MIKNIINFIKNKILLSFVFVISVLIILFFIFFRGSNELILERQKYTDSYLKEFTTNLYPDKIKKEILFKNLYDLKTARDSLQKNGVLFLTHGTATVNSPENYYFSKDGSRDNKKFMDTLSKLTYSKYSHYLRWSGKLTHNERIKTSEIFVYKIKDTVNIIAKEEKIEPKKIPINLAGHSFGASVLILTANVLKKEGYNVRLLFSFNCPNGIYKIYDKDIIHINVYSSDDMIVQLFGNINFLSDFKKFDFYGPARTTFDNAINIRIESLIGEKRVVFLKDGKPDKNIYKNIHHHIARSEIILAEIIKLINEDYTNRKNSNQSDVIKKWNGIYNVIQNKNNIKQIEIKTEDNVINIIDLTNKKNICSIYYNDKINYKNKVYLKFIPFFSYGYAEKIFNINNDSLYYIIKGNIKLINASSNTFFKITIDRLPNNYCNLSIVKKGNIELF